MSMPSIEDLDRCLHGRHGGDFCFGCDGRISVGNPYLVRAFTIPETEMANLLLWRMRDWERNSVQMLARAHFSAKQLHGKKHPELHEMLHGIGVNWAHLDDRERNGTLYVNHETMSFRWTYELLAKVLAPAEERDA